MCVWKWIQFPPPPPPPPPLTFPPLLAPTHPHSLCFVLHGVVVPPFRPPSPVPFDQLNKIGCLASLTQKLMSKEFMGSGTLCVNRQVFTTFTNIRYSYLWGSKLCSYSTPDNKELTMPILAPSPLGRLADVMKWSLPYLLSLCICNR